ncbi:MAG: methyltransferase domain-containing protein [Patescibacteria group bacterium]|nr:methyltransferase domain-containing protein [Patescibacteria group bacterium]MDD4610554.1 methyltransferase domain-containing protein [Patescibacteria group bacterium]
MSVETHIYDKRFFKNTIKLEDDSAAAAVSILIKYFLPRSVIDIGCGCGIYLKEFSNQGVEIFGYDGAPAALESSLVGDKIKLHDLCVPLVINKKFDLCLCVEVAEHLPPEYANILVETLANLSDIIIFSAATPGQGPRSIGHINEQPPEYWLEKFQSKNFIFDQNISLKIKKEMEEKGVVWWITKNLMIFKNDPCQTRAGKNLPHL